MPPGYILKSHKIVRVDACTCVHEPFYTNVVTFYPADIKSESKE